jgi:glycogen synthase
MKILFITNFYPPYSRGGYEQWCQEVAGQFRDHGHSVIILTSRYGKKPNSSEDPDWIHRDLYLEMELKSLRNGVDFFINRNQKEKQNLLKLTEIVNTFKPECIVIWGMWNLPRSLPALAEQLMPDRVVYYMGDYWPTLPSQYEVYWKTHPKSWQTFIPKIVLRSFALRQINAELSPVLNYDRVIYPTEFMRNELERKGILPKDSRIVFGGVDTSLYANLKKTPIKQKNRKDLSLLYVGRLTPEKGVQSTIEAVSHLVHIEGCTALKLTIAGSGDPEFENYLHDLVQNEGIGPYVSFVGAKTKEEMPELYQQADILLFTSIWPEPFGRVLVEAMAAGVVVVGTATGGAAELLVDGENCLTFESGNSKSLANKIAFLLESPDLCLRLIENGQKQALEKYDIKQMAGGIESFLSSLVLTK